MEQDFPIALQGYEEALGIFLSSNKQLSRARSFQMPFSEIPQANMFVPWSLTRNANKVVFCSEEVQFSCYFGFYLTIVFCLQCYSQCIFISRKKFTVMFFKVESLKKTCSRLAEIEQDKLEAENTIERLQQSLQTMKASAKATEKLEVSSFMSH